MTIKALSDSLDDDEVVVYSNESKEKSKDIYSLAARVLGNA